MKDYMKHANPMGSASPNDIFTKRTILMSINCYGQLVQYGISAFHIVLKLLAKLIHLVKISIFS